MIRTKSTTTETADRILQNRVDRLADLPVGDERRIPRASLEVEGVETGASVSHAPIRHEAGLALDAACRQRIDTPDGPVWLEGTLILCECPECHAPVSMRLSVSLANCWRCETCVELTAAQAQAVAQLQSEGLGRERSASAPHRPTTDPRRRGAGLVPLHPGNDPRERAVRTGGQPHLRRSMRDRFDAMPAWLVSLLLHLILLLLLALIFLPQDVIHEAITITTFLDRSDQPGGDEHVIHLEDTLQDDLLPEPLLEMGDRELREFKLRAEQDAAELLVDDSPVVPPPDLEAVKRSITTRAGPTRSLAVRDPRVRADIVRKEGGSMLTEAAVSRGLRWLASVQNRDGSWSLNDWENHDRRNNAGDAAATALALLPFLGAGQTHESGVYKETVAKGLNWLLEHQKTDGDLRAGLDNEAGMYAHGQATIDLIEAFALTGDAKLRDPAQRAIHFIERAQHRAGGWRYVPNQEGDTSVLGWQLMALQSARMSGPGLAVDPDTLQLADYYLDLASTSKGRGGGDVSERYRRDGVLYRYQANHEPTASMTAEGILCRMYLGWRKDDPRLMLAVDWLSQNHAPADGEFNLYYWYYATQVMHHFGGTAWKRWNDQIKDILILSQETKGTDAGSWDPDEDYWASRGGGRIFATAMAVCILEVYYRHLPLFKQLDLD